MTWLTTPAPGPAVSTAVLLVRLAVGVAFVLHGWPKIQKPMEWMGTGDGVPPGVLQAAAAAFEFVGGGLLALGLLTRVAAAGLVAVMAVAVQFHVSQGHPFVGVGGPSWELAAVYLVVNVLIFATGPGLWSVDAVAFRRRR